MFSRVQADFPGKVMIELRPKAQESSELIKRCKSMFSQGHSIFKGPGVEKECSAHLSPMRGRMSKDEAGYTARVKGL